MEVFKICFKLLRILSELTPQSPNHICMSLIHMVNPIAHIHIRFFRRIRTGEDNICADANVDLLA
jgi:hypothetical protein